MTTTPTREVTWGEGIVVAAFRTPGGISNAVDRIRAAMGPAIGSRNTFGKFLRVGDPITLDERDRFRCWLLLVALGEEPGDWGLQDDVVPPAMDVTLLRSVLPRLDSNQQPAGKPFPLVTPLRLAS